MKLRDIFTEAFWKACWKDTLDGFAEYGRAMTGQPPGYMTPEPEQPKVETKPTAEPKAPEPPKP